MYQDLRISLRRVLPAVGIILLIEALLAVFWLGTPTHNVILSLMTAAPGHLLLALMIVFSSALWVRIAIIVALFFADYAQYAFASFYGRFLQPGEIYLMTTNSTGEFIQSALLYFSGGAVLASALTVAAYAGLAIRPPSVEPKKRVSVAALMAVMFWVVSTGSYASADSLTAPDVAFLSINVRAFREWFVRRQAPPAIRQAAPKPGHAGADFDILYLIGESLRADRFPPNGYPRKVTPYLHGFTLPHVAFSNVTSHGDCTGRSVPYLMTAPNRPLHRELYQRPTLFSYAKSAGYRTSFIYANENDWSEFVDSNIDVLQRNAKYTSEDDRWTYNNDENMLSAVSKIANTPGPQFLVVETYTSHWPYGDRYKSCASCRIYRPDNVGKPVPFSSIFHTQIVNSYDNAILYFDGFMRKMVSVLRKPTLIIFTSDHGESLGERGMWGHCSAAPEQFFVPLMFVATDEAVAKTAKFEELQLRADTAMGHANVFPSLLDMLGYDRPSLSWSYDPSIREIPSAGTPNRK